MYVKEVTINNQVGLHARPATFFIQKAKSLLGVLSLGIVKGTTVSLVADGADEKEAVEKLAELVNSDFAE